jgi:phosphinothricin acetyltransferase
LKKLDSCLRRNDEIGPIKAFSADNRFIEEIDKKGMKMPSQGYIDNMAPQDWEMVRAIYQEGLETRNASFELEVPSWEEWDKKHHQECRLVYRDGKEILGWAALSPTSARWVYRGVAEVSIYIKQGQYRKGIGRKLLQALVECSEEKGIWTLQGGIFPENVASIRLHEECGFRLVGRREKVGKHFGTWRDTVILERRSKKAGID